MNKKVLNDICDRLRKDDPKLTILNLNHCGIGNNGAIQLSKALFYNTQLVVLFLDNNHITSKGCKALCTSFKGHPSITYIMMSYNSIGDIGASSIGWMLSSESSSELLSSSYLSSAAPPRLNSSSSSSSSSHDDSNKKRKMNNNNNKIQKLKLIGCDITSVGAKYIADGLKTNNTLKELVLESNSISIAGVISLLKDGLVYNKSLEGLYLRYNNIDNTQNTNGSISSSNDTNKKVPSSVLLLQVILYEVLLPSNETIQTLSIFNGDHHQNGDRDNDSNYEYYEMLVTFYLQLNKLGRRHLTNIEYQYQLWPRILSKASKNKNTDILHFLLKNQPQILV